MRLRSLPVLFLLVLAALLQSCGGFTTVVSVYPDGTAEIVYEIEAPIGKLPDFEQMGKGDWSELFKKDQYLSQEPQVLMDSLMRYAVTPMLVKMQNRGQIGRFSIKDTTEFTNKKVNIRLGLKHFTDVGMVHSAFKRDVPALDSILRKLTGRSAMSKNDSIAIVSLGDSLEMQLYNFVTIPEPEGTREERIEKGKHMYDSLMLIFNDSSSLFSMFGDEGQKMLDSMRILRQTMSDDFFDSIGVLMSMTSSMKELFKPKTILKAPVFLSDNRYDAGLDMVGITPKDGGLEFEPGMFYDLSAITNEPVRQRFKVLLPTRNPTTPDEREKWRSVMRWCDECETGFLSSLFKPTSGLKFYELKSKLYLVEVSCGAMGKDNAMMYYVVDERSRMPAIGLHQFPQAMYVDDLGYELRNGSPHFVKRSSDLLVGKITFNKGTNTLTVDRGSAKETFELGNGVPYLRSAQYKDRAGKWLKFEDYVNGSELYNTTTCADGVRISSELFKEE